MTTVTAESSHKISSKAMILSYSMEFTAPSLPSEKTMSRHVTNQTLATSTHTCETLMLMKTLKDKMLVCKDTIKYNGKKNDLTFASSSHEVNHVQMLNLQATP